MNLSRPISLAHALTVCLLCVLAVPAGLFAANLTPAEERGRQLYEKGTSPSGRPVVAYFGKDLLEVPGESATCTSCHGFDGLGRSESGVNPLRITWRSLMKSYGHIHPNGFEHGPFNENNLKSYLLDGIYPGGRQGDPSMPVYELSSEDLGDLVAYLKRLDGYLDPGISDSEITIGTLQPTDGPLVESGDVLIKTIAALFSDINAQGGIYGRRLKLVSGDLAGKNGAVRSSDGADSPVFALLSPLTPGRELEVWKRMESDRIPLIAPLAPLIPQGQDVVRYRFAVSAGMREQALALTRHAIRSGGNADGGVSIIYPRRDGMEELARELAELFRTAGWVNAEAVGYSGDKGIDSLLLTAVRDRRAGVLLYLGGESDAAPLLELLGAEGERTRLYMTAAAIGRHEDRIPSSLSGRLRLSLPLVPSDLKEWARNRFRSLAERHHLPPDRQALQLNAASATLVLVEGLRRAGRNLTREGLVEALEGLFEFDSGLGPQITFGKNRRNGVLGAHLMEFVRTPGGRGELRPLGWVSAVGP